MSGNPTIDEVCVTAIADAFRGDGEILAHPIGTVPVIGGRLARASFEHDLAITDTVAFMIANTFSVGETEARPVVEAWMPIRDIFDVAWSGRRHVVMGASQIDAAGNQNLSAIGDWRRPKVQLLGMRGAPGNLVNHTTSYWVPNHSTRTFVQSVDVVSGPGYDRVADLSITIQANHEIRLVVSNLGVFDFDNPERRMAIKSRHPGITVEEILNATGFELKVPDEVPETRVPTTGELRLIREVIDPDGLRKLEMGSR